MNDEVMVSICCITYNQEQYIKDALESFLNQKTSYKYEIIVRDDASTDNTVNIIREYEKKYPDIIKPIYEEVNGKLKGVRRGFNVTFDKAKGKYIALCEGDDYWISEYKLQKQVDYMENNPDCTFCFHNANILYMKSNKIKKFTKRPIVPYKKFDSKNGNYNGANIHLFAMGGAPTASFMFRKEDAKDFPNWYYDAPCGDLPLKLFMTSKGYAHYIDEVLSVYRRETGTSVTDNWKKEQEKNIEISQKRINNLIKLLDEFDLYTNYEYKDGLDISREIYLMDLKVIENKYKEIVKDKKMKHYYKIKHNDILGIKLFIRAYFPKIYSFLKKIFRKYYLLKRIA